MHYLAVALITGCLAILFGIAPMGLFLDALYDLEDRFHGSLNGMPLRPIRRMVRLNRHERLHGQIWFAVAGLSLMLVALLACLTG